jgi:hypothetical protein
MYDMDEKEFMKGIWEEVKVVILRKEGEAISCQPGNREWVTVIEAISRTGRLLPAFVIFQGKRMQDQCVNLKMDRDMKITVSEKGWTDSELSLPTIKTTMTQQLSQFPAPRNPDSTWRKGKRWIALF